MSEGYGRERGGAEGQIVMPFYLICDVSYSMIDDMPALNDSLQRLRRAIVAQPIVDDVAHISIMTFSDIAKVVMPLGQMSEQAVPQLSVEVRPRRTDLRRLRSRLLPQRFRSSINWRYLRPIVCPALKHPSATTMRV